ncbi:glycerophosphodiester phosphodiesterase [Treponema sp. OttesenSCG-928-L16]|nr:glycerophosphodiester phosphodiesterase [Treponema sp. OttesenSCG-928-L16]
MIVIAHRGDSGFYPENTMLAFKKAEEAGIDAVEMDIQLTKDGTVVIIHDETVDRVTGVKGYVKDFTFEELRKLNASQGVYGDQFGFNAIPSLEEYFIWAKDTNIITDIELKNSNIYYEGLEEKAIALIKKYGLEKKVLFSSMNHASLIKCKKIEPSIRCGILSARPMANVGHYISSNGLDIYIPDYSLVNQSVVDDCNKHGVELYICVVDDMGMFLRSEKWGCHGVMSNYPAVCKTWLAKNQGASGK